MELDITCKLDVPNLYYKVEMTPAQLLKFHDDLTKFINANYEVLNANTPD